MLFGTLRLMQMNKHIIINLNIPNNYNRIEKEYGYVFVPFAWEISTHVNNPNNNSMIIKFKNGIRMEVLREGHLTHIEDGKLYNIIILTNYALTKNKHYIIPTLNPCNSVRGLVLHGKLLSRINAIKLINVPINYLYIVSKNTTIQYLNYLKIPTLYYYNANNKEPEYQKFDEQLSKLVNIIFNVTIDEMPYAVDSYVI